MSKGSPPRAEERLRIVASHDPGIAAEGSQRVGETAGDSRVAVDEDDFARAARQCLETKRAAAGVEIEAAAAGDLLAQPVENASPAPDRVSGAGRARRLESESSGRARRRR